VADCRRPENWALPCGKEARRRPVAASVAQVAQKFPSTGSRSSSNLYLSGAVSASQ
jgi:hypothetical protein